MKRFIYIILLSGALISACNDEAFISPLKVDPATNETLQWNGGTASYKANQDLDYVNALMFRWSGDRGYPITEDGSMLTAISTQTPLANIKNDLCDITLSMDRHDRFSVTSGYNRYADTVYFEFDIASEVETAKRAVRILPSPGFGHGKISYVLNSWQYDERADTIMLAHIGAGGDHDAILPLRKKGEIVARRAGQFKPWNKLLSDNIFGRESFDVESVSLNSWSWPVLSGEMITYSSAVKHYDNDPLLYDEDVTVTVAAGSWAKVRVIIEGRHYGIQYSIKAISPVDNLEDKTIDGVYWISIPTGYHIETETGPIKP